MADFAAKDKTEKPFTAIFASDGTLRKEVALADDKGLHDLAESGDPYFVSPANPMNNRSFSASSIEVAADGNAFLMRASPSPIVYEISPGGEVVKRFVVNSDDPELVPSEPLHVLGSRIAILFYSNQDKTGEIKIVRYC